MYDTILVPFDTGTDDAADERAGAALAHAVGLAEHFDATIRVLAVVDPSRHPLAFGVGEVDAINRAAERLVDELVAAYDAHGVELQGDVRRGRPHEVALAYADETGADLIVVGRGSAEGAPETAWGRIAERLARLASVPIVVVPEPITEPT